jgi:hypothetical protein
LILRPKGGIAQDPGTNWAETSAARYGRPVFIGDPDEPDAARTIADWLRTFSRPILNVAGPSEGTAPGIGGKTFAILVQAFASLRDGEE